MGDLGTVTRILALRNGAPFTYTTLTAGRKIAPGQITFEDMREVYRANEIDKETQLYGVVADPVAHSLSPLIHNAAFKHNKVNCRYLPFRIHEDELPLFFQWCREYGIGGLSVTIPHKESMLRLVAEVESAANGIGAINTVAIRGEDSSGYNTDYRAAMDCLTEAVATQNTLQKQEDPDDIFKGRGVLILGAGGAARAIGYGLRQKGAMVMVASRTMERTQQLTRDIGAKALAWDARYDIKPGILINCTPVGMHPDVDNSPYDSEKLNEQMIVFDTV